MRTLLRLAVLVLAFAAGSPALAVDPAAGDLAASNAPPNGLAVQVGATRAEFLVDLSLGGKRLVQGLVTDDDARAAVLPGVISAGAHPMVTVAAWDGAPRLPYADRLVNLLILDRDALQAAAPTAAECARVVVPGGIILERNNGVWKTTVNPMPAGFANWTHIDGGPDGNNVATDAEATGIRGVQWVDNGREVRWTKTGPHGGEGGDVRVWGRYAVIDVRYFPEDKDPKFPRRHLLECRDVNNGLLIWQRDRDASLTARRWSMAVQDGRLFTWLKPDGPLTAIDLATGKELATFPGSEVKGMMREPRPQDAARGKKPERTTGMHGENHWVRVTRDTVVANGDGSVRAWTPDGKPKWTFTRAGSRFELPIVDEARGRVYGITTPDPMLDPNNRGPIYWGRWTVGNDVSSIIALDLATGAVVWENVELASRETNVVLFDDRATGKKRRLSWGQLAICGDHVIAFQARAIAGGECSFIASIDAKTGKTAHFDEKALVYTNNHGRVLSANNYCIIPKDGLVYIAGGFDLRTFDPKTGAVSKGEIFSGRWNARCVKPIGTTTGFIFGQTTFLNDKLAGQMVAVARSGCARSPVPAQGVVIFGPHMCACTTHLDGFLATTSRPMPAPVADDRRRVVLPGKPFPAASEKTPGLSSLIASSWTYFALVAPSTTTTIEQAGWTFTLSPERQRLTAKRADATWTFFADARIAASVVVAGDRVVIGTHDGYVHGLDLATGAPRWRYLAAPAHRTIVVNGMLTSAWPVAGVADAGEGTVIASAGTHVELDGGIRVVALRAADGSPVWVRTLRKTPSNITPDGKGEIVDRSLLNTAPKWIDGKVTFDGDFHLGKFAFDPGETDAQLQTRLSTPPKKTKLPVR